MPEFLGGWGDDTSSQTASTILPSEAAKKVCQLRNWRVSNLEIQKILYLAHMVYMGRYGEDQPLVAENFEAWDYGPVLPSVYHRVKAFGSGPVRNVFQAFQNLPPGRESDVLEEAVRSVANKTPGELVAITHWEQGAWAKHYTPGWRGHAIPNHDIYEEYLKRVA
ncbi:MAG: DUF4065 domain-containing protein [Alphaproteobacteria bacterium]|jgi:uncharacterized phage-associated protein|nr:DUF4065 domain-containing protein [Alphaproteobacteria bacterium]